MQPRVAVVDHPSETLALECPRPVQGGWAQTESHPPLGTGAYAQAMPTSNVLYYGDNLDVLRQHIKDESVDLVYLDPPFNSNASYSVLFAEQDGARSAAQVNAFEDTWRWDQAAVYDYEQTVERGGRVADALIAMRTLLGGSNMLAYLSMMAPRLVELRRVLKPTGCIYLHCDPTASHYLKLLMDAVFSPVNFRNEIIWKRYGAHSNSKGYGRVHDALLFYSRSKNVIFNKRYQPYDDEYVRERFRFSDPDGRRWSEQNLANPDRRPNLTYPFTARNGVTYQPPPNGWKYTRERMAELDAQGRLHYPAKADGRLRLKNYMDEMPGVSVQDLWTDVGLIGGTSPERLPYPTQKPLALLERIISASSNVGDVVLDPFCGCGTAIDAAERLGRRWIGIDITHLAINLVKHRLADTHADPRYPITLKYNVVGEPVDLAGARELAASDPWQFQLWALGLVGARPAELRKGADRGIDGQLFFHDEQGGKTKQVILQVKAGHVRVNHVRELGHVVDREKAAIGVLISMETPTQPMRGEAASAGFYEAPWAQKYPKLQLLTITELLSEKGIAMPEPGTMSVNVTHKRAPRATKKGPAMEQAPLL